jgi:hypothetical protein
VHGIFLLPCLPKTRCLEILYIISISGSLEKQMKNSSLDVEVSKDVVQPHFITRKQSVTPGRERHLGVLPRMVHARTRRRGLRTR